MVRAQADRCGRAYCEPLNSPRTGLYCGQAGDRRKLLHGSGAAVFWSEWIYQFCLHSGLHLGFEFLFEKGSKSMKQIVRSIGRYVRKAVPAMRTLTTTALTTTAATI